jgi:hypothetical protein
MAKQQEPVALENERHEQTKKHTQIGEIVLTTLGKPGDFQRVQVRQLWDDRYRVNIYIGADAISATVAHSFFLTVDVGGRIVTSTPLITRRY